MKFKFVMGPDGKPKLRVDRGPRPSLDEPPRLSLVADEEHDSSYDHENAGERPDEQVVTDDQVDHD